MRTVNWAETAFGPRDAWPPALQEAAAICLDAAAPMAIYWGEDFRLLYNDAWAPFLADRHPGALGQPARHVWPEIWNELQPDFARVMASGEGSRRERQRFFLSRPDGPAETFWDYSFNPIRDARGAVAGILNVSVESTALVAAEQRLKENKAFLRVVLDNSVNGLYGVDRDGTTTFCNSTFLTMLGFRAEADAIGRRLHDVIHHSRADGSAYAKVDCPIYTTAQTGVPAHVVDEVFFRLDGTSFPVEYWVRPILQDGAVQGAVCTFVDLTARRRAEQALRESEMRFRLVADSAPVPRRELRGGIGVRLAGAGASG
jgi:PAS domain S-box-containing protein